jgi:hypothetical protein
MAGARGKYEGRRIRLRSPSARQVIERCGACGHFYSERPRSTTAATVFLFPTLISSTAVEQESAERGVPCGPQGEHGGQCYEAASATGAEP